MPEHRNAVITICCQTQILDSRSGAVRSLCGSHARPLSILTPLNNDAGGSRSTETSDLRHTSGADSQCLRSESATLEKNLWIILVYARKMSNHHWDSLDLN